MMTVKPVVLNRAVYVIHWKVIAHQDLSLYMFVKPVSSRLSHNCYFHTTVVLLLVNIVTSAQPTKPHPIQTQLETGGFISSGHVTPFWLRANQYGMVPLETPVATFRFLAAKAYAPKDTAKPRANRFSWGFGVYPVVNAGVTNQFLLPEAYGKLKYGAVELWVGRRRTLTGLGDSVLSSGFMVGSGNALPIPKVQLATLGYAPLKFLGSFIAINAGYAHGWFTNTYINQSYLHQKYVYWRFGKPKATVKVHLGMNHQVQWGGHADYLLGNPLAVDGKLPSAFKHYGDIILATRPLETKTDDYTDFDGSYRIGNHVGGHDLGIEIMTRRETILLYYQHPFEDVSGLLFQNMPDGLMGLSWQRHLRKASGSFRLNRLVLEFLNTLDQSGATFWRAYSRFQGADNYFNHSQYREGWSYRGRTIGTPFIAPQREFQPAVLQAASAFFPDNRVRMWYAGAEGQLTNRLFWLARFAYSRHYGTYATPFDPTRSQVSFLFSTETNLAKSNKTRLRAAIAIDRGQVYPETVGVSMSLLRTIHQ